MTGPQVAVLDRLHYILQMHEPHNRITTITLLPLQVELIKAFPALQVTPYTCVYGYTIQVHRNDIYDHTTL